MFGDLLKATVAVVTLPLDVVKDVVTLGGAITDEESAIAKKLKTIEKNIDNAVKPDSKKG